MRPRWVRDLPQRPLALGALTFLMPSVAYEAPHGRSGFVGSSAEVTIRRSRSSCARAPLLSERERILIAPACTHANDCARELDTSIASRREAYGLGDLDTPGRELRHNPAAKTTAQTFQDDCFI